MEPELRTACDAAIAERVRALPEYSETELVLSYLDIDSEVATRGIIAQAWKDGKRVALPRCLEQTCELAWYELHEGELESLEMGPLGVLEPAPRAERKLAVAGMREAIALVPGLGFDKAGQRLGYGGGYYDRFLAGFAGVAVGLCREAQLMDSLLELGAVEPHDVPVHIVVTEERIICIREGCAS
jgi:5-formyltetrahydrofolate cyclo-ligase